MLKPQQILAIIAIVLIFSSWSGLVWAAGKSCTNSELVDPSSNPNGCPAGEQCCCCDLNQSCPSAPPGGAKGVCFPKTIITGKDNKGNDITIGVACEDVICPFSVHTDIEDFIMSAVNYIFYISVILAPLMILIGAAVFLTSAGSPKQTKLGTSIIQWTAIGFAVILFAKGIVAIIKMILVG